MAEGGQGGQVVLRDRFTLVHDHPLPELNTPSALAFAAEDRRDPARSLFVLIADPELPLRINILRNLKGLQAAGLMTCVEFGVVPWPPLGRNCMAVVYQRPGGPRVMTHANEQFPRLDERAAPKMLLQPAMQALSELALNGITHRAIRPDNLFYLDAERTTVVLGDCATAPPAMEQPIEFETIESAMAHPSGRGSGSPANDMYSLGATLMVMLLGYNPLAGVAPQEILDNKIARGSYAYMVGDERLPLPMIEVLRGLMTDTPQDRWNLGRLEMWLNGRRQSPIQPRPPRRASRAFHFKDQEFYSLRILAHAMAKDPKAAVQVIQGGRLEIWLRRAMEHPEYADAVGQAARQAESQLENDGQTALDIMVAKVCTVLDPPSPIRYQHFAVAPDGFGSALAVAMVKKNGNEKLLVDMLMQEIPSYWISSQEEYDPEHAMLLSNYKELKTVLRSAAWGYGVERALYELNEGLPCQSSLLVSRFVLHANELLEALDLAAVNADTGKWPMDRHIAAFLAARFNVDLDPQLSALNDPDVTTATLGMVSLLALVQWRRGPDQVHNLTNWVGQVLGPVIEAYHSQDRRRTLEQEIPRVIKGGSLTELYNLVDNQDERTRDEEGFRGAIDEYAAAEYEIRQFRAEDEDRNKQAEALGQQTAATISVLLALVALTITLLFKVW